METIGLDLVAALRKQGELGAALKQEIAAARTECARRRTLVLRYPDLAKRLTEPPHRWTAPERWNGYIPPETSGDIPNHTPARAALLDLVAEAERRAQPGRAAA